MCLDNDNVATLDNNISPARMDPAIQNQARELQQMLSMFKHATSTPLSGFIM
jgi:hypothetical protein